MFNFLGDVFSTLLCGNTVDLAPVHIFLYPLAGNIEHFLAYLVTIADRPKHDRNDEDTDNPHRG